MKKRALPQGRQQLRLRCRDRRRLIRWGEWTGCPLTLRRCLAVAKVASGQSRAQAARELLCAPSTVVSAVQRYQESGRDGLLDKRAQNGRRKVDEYFRQTLRRVLEGTPQQSGWRRTTWTRELLVREVERRGRVHVSPATMGRALASVGAQRRRPRPVVRCPWPERRRQRRLWQLKCRAAFARPDEPVLFEDEMDVHLNPKIGPDWTLPGQRREVVTPGNNQKRYVAGALDASTARMTWVQGVKKTSALFIDLVRAVDAAYPRAKRLHFILDNAATHSSKKTQTALEALGERLVLHFLPPYCPEGNRIERVWWDVHANVTRNHRCKKMESLMTEVDAYLDARNAQRTASPLLRAASARRAA
ncbi:IS630 family transposase [Corallococcus exercitus]|uniref:IS630 family transposase n=1 Tax=Corallococcus exercitus TaxID=2316736 RepID=UPI003F6D7E03